SRARIKMRGTGSITMHVDDVLAVFGFQLGDLACGLWPDDPLARYEEEASRIERALRCYSGKLIHCRRMIERLEARIKQAETRKARGWEHGGAVCSRPLIAAFEQDSADWEP